MLSHAHRIESLITVCADVGSVAKGNFGWWSSSGACGDRPSGLASYIAEALNDGSPVALGFECPLFVPLVQDELLLTSARPGEGSRPWSVGAGCGSLTTGLVQVAWVLQEIRKRLDGEPQAYLSWEEFEAAGSGLFLWEAFVTGKAKGDSHTADAKLGATSFINSLPIPQRFNSVICESGVYSLVGAALLRTKWSSDTQLLFQPCLVLRASVA